MAFRTVVVPLDGSSFSLHALPVALGLATTSGGAVSLLHVREPLPSSIDLPGVPVLDPGLAERFVIDREPELRELADRLHRRWKVDVSVSIRPGRAAEAIAAHARESGAELIVLTTHGRGGVSRLWLGSVADELLRIADMPVLAVRPARGAPGLSRVKRLRHVVVPLDGSGLAEQALAPAAGVARLGKGRVTLLRVVTPHLTIARPAPVTRRDRADLARQRHEAEEYLRGVAQRLRREGVRVATRVVADRDAGRGIVRSAAAIGADLVAMASHGLGGAGRFLRGSVCDKVLRGSTRTAVLLTRPRST